MAFPDKRIKQEFNHEPFEQHTSPFRAGLFILLVDRIQSREEAAILRDLPRDYLEGLALNIPEGMRKLIRDVITVLLERLEVPPEEIEAVTEHVKKREDRTMFDGLVKVVLEDRQLAREEGREEGIQIGTEKGREEAYEEKLASARRLKKYGIPVEIIASSLELGTEEVAAL